MPTKHEDVPLPIVGSDMTAAEYTKLQVRETVDQEQRGVTVRLATITCRCGWQRSLMFMYKCLYCGEWMCELCAEAHFGKTRAEYHDGRAVVVSQADADRLAAMLSKDADFARLEAQAEKLEAIRDGVWSVLQRLRNDLRVDDPCNHYDLVCDALAAVEGPPHLAAVPAPAKRARQINAVPNALEKAKMGQVSQAKP